MRTMERVMIILKFLVLSLTVVGVGDACCLCFIGGGSGDVAIVGVMVSCFSET